MKRIMAALAGALVLGAGPAPKVGKLLPSSAIIFASGMHGEKDAHGIVPDELYAADIDGRHVVRLTFGLVGHNHFSVSPDRKLVVTNRYVRGDTSGDGRLLSNDFEELWIVDLEHGTERSLLPGVYAGLGGLAWSPDSKWVYFSAYVDPAKGQEGGTDIFRMPAAGGPPEPLTRDLHKLLGESDPRKFVSDVDVSPDGQWMAMVYTPASWWGPRKVKTRIALARVDGSAARVLTDGGPLPPGRRGRWPNGDFDPDFSPDGKAVAFMRMTDAGYANAELSSGDVMTETIDGKALSNLAPPGNTQAHGIPSWGPCGVLHTVWDSTSRRIFPQYHPPQGGTVQIELPTSQATHAQWIPGAKCRTAR